MDSEYIFLRLISQFSISPILLLSTLIFPLLFNFFLLLLGFCHQLKSYQLTQTAAQLKTVTLKKWERTLRTCCKTRKRALSCLVNGRSRSGRNYNGCYWVRGFLRQVKKGIKNGAWVQAGDKVKSEYRETCRWGREISSNWTPVCEEKNLKRCCQPTASFFWVQVPGHARATSAISFLGTHPPE